MVKNKAKSFSELFAKNYEKDREKFKEATKGLRADLPIERKFMLIRSV